MAFQIKKIKTFPYAFKDDDEVVATGDTLAEIPSILEELGFGKSKKAVVEGSIVYYKGKTNAVYVKYVHNLKT